MKRMHSGIPGLDRLLSGGFPEGSCIAVTGEPGTGKTLMGMQFLYDGAAKQSEAGMLIQAQEFDKTLYWYEEMLGWDFRALQEKRKLAIFSFKPKDYDKFTPTKLEGEVLGKLRNIIVPMQIKRCVIDSVTPLEVSMNDPADYRRSIYELIEFLKGEGITTLLITEGQGKQEEHLCDGVLNLKFTETQSGESIKELRVGKMVATNFPNAWYPVTISDRIGFSVRPFR